MIRSIPEKMPSICLLGTLPIRSISCRLSMITSCDTCAGRRLDLPVQMIPNAAHLLDRSLLMLMRSTHRRSPPEDSGFQGTDTQSSSLPVLRLSHLRVRGMVLGIRFRFQSPPANSPATTSGTPTVAGFATASNASPVTLSGTSGLTTIRRAFFGASKTSPAAG